MSRADRLIVTIAVVMVWGLVRGACGADTNMLPNPSFEFGFGSIPQDWSGFGFAERALSGGGHGGERCATIQGTGAETSWWQPTRWQPVDYNKVYEVSFWSRAHLTRPGGALLAGLSLAGRRTAPSETWQHTRFCFRSPDYLPEREFRLGECFVDGTVYFDEVSLRPVIAIHRSRGLGRFVLGTGESITAGHYSAIHDLAGIGSTDARFLDRYTASFDHDRWVMDGIDEVVYRHDISYFGVEDMVPNAGFSPQAMESLRVVLEDPRSLRCLLQDAAAVEITVARCDGTVSVQFTTDGKRGRWREAGVINRPTTIRIEAPRNMLPARELWVRLKSLRATRVEVTGYRYTAMVSRAPSQVDRRGTVIGDTRYLTILEQDPDVTIQLVDVGELTPGGRGEVRAVIGNRRDRRRLRASVLVRTCDQLISRTEEEFALARDSQRQVSLGYQVGTEGEQTLRIALTDATTDEILGELETAFEVSSLRKSGGGEALVCDPAVTIWWCRPERKVGRDCPAPGEKGTALRISAAANEYEAAQLVVIPTERLKECAVGTSDLVSASGARIAASEVEVRYVGYVPVTLPSDEAGSVGDWPDPLLPYVGPVGVPPRTNQPLWITVHVPPATPPGDYRGEITITAEGMNHTVPVEVHVWDFELPRETHLRSACGLSTGLIRLYHNLDTREKIGEVLDLYLADFAAHRLSPAGLGHDIWADWRKLPTGEVEPTIDFSEFDKDARRIVDELGCNSLMVKLPGLGGRTPSGWQAGNIAGFRPGSPQHEAAFTKVALAIQEHLAERGWLDKAYAVWFDEMRKGDFGPVRDGMALIKRAAPRLKRMLAAVPNRDLAGYVDLWCVPLHKLEATQAAERRAAGEEVWWYPDKRPSAPSLFGAIDHAGTEMRLCGWATWKYGVDGISLPDTNYWHSSAAYPGELRQNPWTDPMSWAPGIAVKAGEKQAWGNGYGRLLYPPEQRPSISKTKRLEGPVPSLRWELLRDGVEDYDYLWLLRSEVERLRQSGADPCVYQEAEKLLEVPPDVWTDATHFTTEPEPIHTRRAKVAEAIESLRTR